MGFYTQEEIKNLGFGSVGDNVLISTKSSLYNLSNIHIGNNVRIDDYCVLSAGSGGIYLGNYIHIAVYCSLIGDGRIVLEDFSGLSSRVSVYSSNDDYSGGFLTNPTIPSEFTHVTHAPVKISKHVIIGSGAIVLPGVILEQGCAVGALSLVKKDCKEFGIYLGSPAKLVSERKRDLLDIENKFNEMLVNGE